MLLLLLALVAATPDCRWCGFTEDWQLDRENYPKTSYPGVVWYNRPPVCAPEICDMSIEGDCEEKCRSVGAAYYNWQVADNECRCYSAEQGAATTARPDLLCEREAAAGEWKFCKVGTMLYYRNGEDRTNVCENGGQAVLSKDECMFTAAAALGKAYGGDSNPNDRNSPAGCYTGRSLKLHFNAFSGAEGGDSGEHKVCKRGTPPTTPARTTPAPPPEPTAATTPEELKWILGQGGEDCNSVCAADDGRECDVQALRDLVNRKVNDAALASTFTGVPCENYNFNCNCGEGSYVIFFLHINYFLIVCVRRTSADTQQVSSPGVGVEHEFYQMLTHQNL